MKQTVMREILRFSTAACRLAGQHCTSLYYGRATRHVFQDVRTYCMFIGYSRSGHSLIGSLLDAHPNMVIAQELHALQYMRARFTRSQLYYLLLERSRRFTAAGRRWGEYIYVVPNQWQGKFTQIYVIGDKKGGGSSMILQLYPHLLQRLRNVVGVPTKFIHVVRNPYDNITTIARKQAISLEESIDHYFSLCATVAKLRTQIPSTDLFECTHEDFVARPRVLLQQLCHFLGVEAPADYLDACAGIVFPSPRRSRNAVEWTPEAIARVRNNIEQFPFLQGYTSASLDINTEKAVADERAK